MSDVIYESIDGKRGVRVQRESEQTLQFMTMRNGFQWCGMPVNRELLLAMHAAIESVLPDDFATASAPAEITPAQALTALDEVIPPHLRATRHGEGFMGERYAILKAFIEQPRAHQRAEVGHKVYGFDRETLADLADGLDSGYEQRINVGEECSTVESTTAAAARFIRAALAGDVLSERDRAHLQIAATVMSDPKFVNPEAAQIVALLNRLAASGVAAPSLLRRIWLEAGGNPEIGEPTEQEVLDLVHGMTRLADEAIAQEEGAGVDAPSGPPTDLQLQALFRESFGAKWVFSPQQLAYARAVVDLARSGQLGVSDEPLEELFHKHVGVSWEFTGPQRAYARAVAGIANGVPPAPLDWSDTDRELGKQVWKFADRMNDLADDDSADKVLRDFMAVVNPIFSKAMAGFRG